MIGVLALQGDYEAHERQLRALGETVCRVTQAAQLDALRGIVLPGGESTALLRLMPEEFRAALIRIAQNGTPIFGTCAGLILLAERVENPGQQSLGLLDVTVSRNAYGRQVDSFIDRALSWSDDGRRFVETRLPGRHAAPPSTLEGIFIRAPRITTVGGKATVLAFREDEPVLVRQGSLLGATFHPELSEERSVVHELFLSLVHSRHDSIDAHL